MCARVLVAGGGLMMGFSPCWEVGWGDLPAGAELIDVAGVAVDGEDKVYVFTRGTHPVLVFASSGSLLATWGHDLFVRPHGIGCDADGNVVCVDDEGQQVLVCSPEGKVLRRVAAPDQRAITGYVPGYPHSVRVAAGPFCFPTHALHEGGRLTVADGYGNARVHVFDDENRLLGFWGSPGSGAGEFVIPHGLLRGEDGALAVCDRENERIQWFDGSGRFLRSWDGLNCPNNLARLPDGRYVVAELGRRVSLGEYGPAVDPGRLPARVTVRDGEGRLLAETTPYGAVGEDVFFAPHGLAVDSTGAVYIGEVTTAYGQGLAPHGRPMLHKLTFEPA